MVIAQSALIIGELKIQLRCLPSKEQSEQERIGYKSTPTLESAARNVVNFSLAGDRLQLWEFEPFRGAPSMFDAHTSSRK